MFVQIHGQNISIEHNNTSLNYTVETVAVFKCKNPKSNASQEWRCTAENNKTYSWKQKTNKTKDCEETSTQSKELFSAFPSRSGNLSDLLIGICSFLGFIMIVVLFGLLYKNRARHGKRYNNTANQHARQSPFTSMPEGENQSKGKFADGEENLVYANIIPIKVNQETIYAEVETGKIGKSRPTNIKLTIDDDQLHTTYAEIRHSVIPEDQRR
ncbi:uncharacterized protein LOC124195620 isoform X2 [Daphnia pulex]|uniref:uncharacterized protein LOC124195620 isoform X2 n=1 Tax=Daphnia pulex TaxID=6669 RepID=UPI001EE06D2D|nr:uncharacterized protein LOC124195620 isoform X2 [Daphnia pulex]